MSQKDEPAGIDVLRDLSASHPDLMGLMVSITDDLERVAMCLLCNGRLIGQIEMTGEQTQQIIGQLNKFCSLLSAKSGRH